LREDELSITDAALHALVTGFTREAGVRGLERQLGKVTRKAVRKIAAGDATALVVDEPDLKEYVGRPRFRPEDATRAPIPGLATGLAVTGAGGDVLTIEVTAMEGEPAMQVTGQLGDVMSESAQIALSFVRANANELGVLPGAFEHRRFHLHVPSGAIPKDGPSAGVTIATALASELTRRPVRGDIAMTGEITLSGRVLPVGGIKEKVLAARRVGIREVIMPRQNEKNVNEDLSPELRKELTIHFVQSVDEVLLLALLPAPKTTGLKKTERRVQSRVQ